MFLCALLAVVGAKLTTAFFSKRFVIYKSH